MQNVKRGVVYRATGARPLEMDIYYPEAHQPPVVVVVLGYPDVDVPLPLGAQFRALEMIATWAKRIAAAGMAAVVYETRSPQADLDSVLEHLKSHGPELGIDSERLGLLAFSGHAPVAFSALLDGKARCGAISCGYLLDADGSGAIARAAAQYRFANPGGGRTLEEMPTGVPLLLVRAGRDQFPGVNESIDAFVAHASRRDLPFTLLNCAGAEHAFDLRDSADARIAVQATVAFLRANLIRSAPQ